MKKVFSILIFCLNFSLFVSCEAEADTGIDTLEIPSFQYAQQNMIPEFYALDPVELQTVPLPEEADRIFAFANGRALYSLEQTENEDTISFYSLDISSRERLYLCDEVYSTYLTVTSGTDSVFVALGAGRSGRVLEIDLYSPNLIKNLGSCESDTVYNTLKHTEDGSVLFYGFLNEQSSPVFFVDRFAHSSASKERVLEIEFSEEQPVGMLNMTYSNSKIYCLFYRARQEVVEQVWIDEYTLDGVRQRQIELPIDFFMLYSEEQFLGYDIYADYFDVYGNYVYLRTTTERVLFLRVDESGTSPVYIMENISEHSICNSSSHIAKDSNRYQIFFRKSFQELLFFDSQNEKFYALPLDLNKDMQINQCWRDKNGLILVEILLPTVQGTHRDYLYINQMDIDFSQM
ncbi:hypothetical protein LJC32_01030 [Oscillospiraceae bacterium OttesenSCG-928-F05]|nr:hypothetical protein [Oscillospiraceae bacterium OttesenSCG-928-F05]